MESKQNAKIHQAPNKHLKEMNRDILYHIALDTETHNFKEMFSDIKYVCFGGSSTRMEKFANVIAKELNVQIPTGMTLKNIAAGADRYVLYKVGPVLSVNHGMGIPSLSIIFHEIVKLLHYAECTDVVFVRLGTSGGLGLSPGSIVISDSVVDGALNPFMELAILGKTVQLPGALDQNFAKKLLSFSAQEEDRFDTRIGKTMCTFDFYEGQARVDGAFCDYTEEDKMAFLNKIHSEEGVLNIEMESLCFAAYCKRADITGAVVCVTLLNRLNGDQIDTPHEVMEEWQTRPQKLMAKLIKADLGIE